MRMETVIVIGYGSASIVRGQAVTVVFIVNLSPNHHVNANTARAVRIVR